MKNKRNPSSFRQFIPYYKPYIGMIILDLICAAFTTVCELVLPLIVRYITNEALYGASSLVVGTVLKLGAALR